MGVLRWCRLAGALLTLAVATTPRLALAQEILLADRGPRFLLAASSRGGKPVEIQAGSNAMLRRVVSLKVEHPTVGSLLDAIERQTGLRFYYGRDIVSPDRPVSLRADSITVAAALMGILVDAGVDVLLSRAGPQVALVRQPARELADTGAIVGRVTAKADNAPLVGATVVVEGTRHSATTGNDGRYRIAYVPAGTYTVQARYIGYAPGTLSVTMSAGQEGTADFSLGKSVQRLDEVVTTGTVIETEVKALPSPIAVFNGEDIREKHVQRIAQLFRGDVPGVTAPDQGALDDLTRIFVRGGSDLNGLGAIKTYVDGVEVVGSSFLSMIDPSSVDRVELIRGPQASTIYGSEALNGVLQIFTKKGGANASPTIEGRAAGGAIQSQWVSKDAVPTYTGNAAVSGGGHGFAYNVGAGRSYKGEWLSEYRSTENNVYGSVSGGQGWLSAELSGRLGWATYGQPFSPVLEPYRASLKGNFANFNYQEGALGLTLRAQAAPHWQHVLTLGVNRLLQEQVQHTPKFVTPADSMLLIYSSESVKSTFLYSTTLQGGLAPALTGSITAGANLTATKGTSFSGQADPSTQANGDLATLFFADREVTNNRGYFTQGQLGIADALFLTAGLRAEDNDAYGQNYGLAWSPRAGLSYVRKLSGGLTLKTRASYGKSIRAPAFSQRNGSVGPFAVYLPNPILGPASQHGVDAGIELYAGTWGSLQATYYNQTADDLIDQVLVTPGAVPTYQYQNIGQIKNEGLELQASLSVFRGLILNGSYTITHSSVKRLSPSYTGDLQTGDQLLSIPKHTAGGTASYSLGGWSASLGVLHSGPWVNTDWVSLYAFYFGAAPYRGSGRDYWITYPGFTKLRMTASRRVRAGVTAFLAMDNLTNNYAIEDYNYTASPGRTTTAGLDFKF